MDWNYKMFINGIYWKGYAGKPTQQQIEVEKRSFNRSEYNKGGKLEVDIKKS